MTIILNCFFRKDNVLKLWNYLIELLKARRLRLELSLGIQRIFQEMLYILDWMEEIKARLLSEDYGKHLMGVDDLLQKHSLIEADIHVLGERVKTVNTQADRFVDGDFSDVGGKNFIRCSLNMEIPLFNPS